ncbi:MAG TPA: Na+/H+ antiporter subunit E [Candidatus Omnitrophota bacterium]|nr:Na+/H+ antiporter subunit E [Candidatus Omnitrophota bacterium]HPD84907.1 Na+/H+ antiporter subunit E [Candidatus Omnitrophota bacterium]HRZ03765.1 Na+/H+ antiporter subunit E [Candidatus Omnitrophota bacterium]
MAKRIVLFIVGLITWCVLNWPPDWQHITVGVLVAAFVDFIVADLFTKGAAGFSHPHRWWYFIFCYVPIFFWELVKTNIDVAIRVLHPRLPINPGIVKVKTTLKSDVALTFLCCSITLTPGTMVVDIDREAGILYVHWIDVKTQDMEAATKLVVGRFERILTKIFD